MKRTTLILIVIGISLSSCARGDFHLDQRVQLVPRETWVRKDLWDHHRMIYRPPVMPS
jgi:hypothetical protein